MRVAIFLFTRFSIILFGQFKKRTYLCSTRTPKPLNNAQIGGRFIFIAMSIHFDKSYTTPTDIVQLLRKRGLEIADENKARHYIEHIGYYRLSAYLYPLLEEPKSYHHFKPQSTFNNAISLYRFDKKLRMFLFNEIEKIEVSFRSTIANIVTEETGNMFWMTDASMFANEEKFLRTMSLIDKELKGSKEEFIKHFREKYSNDYPPAWMIVEILPLGVVTRIYENIANNTLRKKIASRFGLPVPVFSSWITIVTLTRNSCCHHARVWNKENAIMPMQIKKSNRAWISPSISPKRIFYDICILKWFLDIIVPGNHMKENLKALLTQYPNVDIAAMGFPKDWEMEALWR